MQKYIKIYMKHYWYDETDFIPCEVCWATSTEIHHINWRIGKNYWDVQSLIALCRECHLKAHSSEITKEQLIEYKKK